MLIFEHNLPTLLIWLGFLLALAATFTVWRFIKPTRLATFLFAMRTAFLLLFVWILLMPAMRRTSSRVIKPKFFVMLDHSKSMGLALVENAPSRWDTAQAVLQRPWRTRVTSRADLSSLAFADSLDAAPEDTGSLLPDGKSTHLRDALETLRDRTRGQHVGGVLLLSDGLDTRETEATWTDSRWPWPIYAVRMEPPGVEEKIEPDVRVTRIDTPRRVNVGWVSEIRAVIAGFGTRGQAVTAQLFKEGGLVAEEAVQIPASGGSKEARFKITHDDVGLHSFEVRVPFLGGETQTNDNMHAISVQVVDDRNRLLYVEGLPRWESKFLSRALKGNEQVSAMTFIRGPGGKFTIGRQDNVTADLSEAELALFKVVIIGDLSADELGEGRAANLVSFTEAGGSLVLLGGTRAWSATGFGTTPLKNVLPAATKGIRREEGRFKLALTDEGKVHPAFAGDLDLWKSVTPLLSLFHLGKPKAGAEVLVKSPATGKPVILSQRYGQGRVAAVLSDSLWKWQMAPGAREKRHYERFWNQLIEWMLPEEQELGDDKLDAFVDRETISLGESLLVSGRKTGVALGDLDGEPTCELATPDKRVVPYAMTKQPVQTASGQTFPGFSVSLTPDEPGFYQVTLKGRAGDEDLVSDPVAFFVQAFSIETAPRPADHDLMKALTSRSHGKFFDNPERLNAHLSSLPLESKEEEALIQSSLWQRNWIIACLLLLLCVEWAVRKARNLA